MTAATARVRNQAVAASPWPSTASIATATIGAVAVELLILRIATRTAVHIPGIEAVRGPYRGLASIGRLAFVTAVLLLACLLLRLARDLYRDGLAALGASVLLFIGLAGAARAGLVEAGVVAAVTPGVVVLLGLGVLRRHRASVAAPLAVFALAFAMAAATRVWHDETGALPAGLLGWVTLRSEQLALLAAVSSGPLVRRSLGLRPLPKGREAWVAGAVALLVAGAAAASASTVNILLLWNFGLSGALPPPVYAAGRASLVVAVAANARHGRRELAAALVLVAAGGVALVSSYQSGLVVAGLALGCSATADAPERQAALRPARLCPVARDGVVPHWRDRTG